ncbi:MAG: SCP2 sterol-binding domain-containing protein [Deltaproteobacteria bacterium]|nr:SCP2 sterol-binding domain-containing protein [Deltaproteobacteria bacterium]
MSEITKVFEEMNGRITNEKAKKINSTYLFDIGGDDGGKWFADLTKEAPPYIEKRDGEAKCTITVPKPEDWVAIATGKMNPTSAFMQGKIKVKGDMSLAMKLQTLLA